jgi:hypothetical protein
MTAKMKIWRVTKSAYQHTCAKKSLIKHHIPEVKTAFYPHAVLSTLFVSNKRKNPFTNKQPDDVETTKLMAMEQLLATPVS